jgi:hypothetical protein
MCSECAILRQQLADAVPWPEHEALMDRYQLAESGRHRAELEARRLKAELNGSRSKESMRVKEVCEYHDDLWRRTFPKARGLSYPMDGVNAKAVRRALRWGHDVDVIKRALAGAFASEFHRSKSRYLTLESVLRDENRFREHLERADRFVSVITGDVMAPETVAAIEKAEERRDELQQRKARHWERVEREDPGEAVLTRLSRDGWEWRSTPKGGWEAQCPAHDGHDMNLSIDWSGDGDRLLLKCWSRGCEAAEVMAALDLPLFTLFRRPLERAA